MALTHIDLGQINEIKLRCPNTRAFLGVANCEFSQHQHQEQSSDDQDESRSNRRSHLDVGNGELIVATNRLYWIKENKGDDQLDEQNIQANSSSNQGLILDYVDISLHAVSRDNETFPHKCIYMVVDKTFPEALSLVQTGQAHIFHSPGQENDYSDDDDGQTLSTDVFFVPREESTLDAIFRALSDCQAMHPDPEDQDYSDDPNNPSDDEEDVETHGAEDSCKFDENLYESVDD